MQHKKRKALIDIAPDTILKAKKKQDDDQDDDVDDDDDDKISKPVNFRKRRIFANYEEDDDIELLASVPASKPCKFNFFVFDHF